MKAFSSLGKGFGLSDAKASGYDTDGIWAGSLTNRKNKFKIKSNYIINLN